MKHVLHIRTYKVPYKLNTEGKVEEDNTKPLTSRDLIDTQEVEIEDISVELKEITQRVSQFNQRQVKYAEEGIINSDYIKKQIVTK